MTSIKVLSMLFLAFIVGGWMMGSMIIVPAQKELSASEYTAVEQAQTKNGVRYFPIVFAVTVILLATLIYMNWGRGLTTWLLAGSLAFVISGAAVTAIKMIPLNSRIEGWSIQAPPRDWQKYRDEWHNTHRMRTVLAVIAFVLLSAAIVQQSSTGTKSATKASAYRKV